MKNAHADHDRRPDENAAGVPRKSLTGHGVEADVGAGLGMMAGAAAGALAGPVGVVVGATLGGVVGETAGRMLHEQQELVADRDRELDDQIGVTSGPIGAGAPITFADAPKAATFLRADHELLETLAAGIVKAIEESDREDLPRLVTSLQTALVEHLDHEEKELLPAYAEAAPQDAARIRREHAAFRKTATELEVATDLHTLRADMVRDLVDRLRAHAAHENETMYAWAAKH